MVIPEALARGIPVLTSTTTGAAAEVSSERGQILSLDSSFSNWSRAAEQLLKTKSTVPLFERSWSQVAEETVAVLK